MMDKKFKIIWNNKYFGIGIIKAKNKLQAHYKIERKIGENLRHLYRLEEVKI